MRLVERSRELDSLRSVIDASFAGDGQIALVSGAAGSGKTELLREARGYARSVGGNVIAGQGAVADRRLPLAFIEQLISGAAMTPEEAEKAARAVEEAARAAEEAPCSAEEPLHAHHLRDMCRLLRSPSNAPVLLVADDIHHVDPASRQVLMHFAQNGLSRPLGFLFSERVGSWPEYQMFRSALMRMPNCHALWLPRLSPDGVRRVLADSFPEEAAARQAPAYHDASGGSPLFVRALVQDHEAERGLRGPGEDGCHDGCDGALVTGEAYAQAVLTCLYRSEPGALRTARWLAVAGPVGAPLIERLEGIEGGSVSRHLHELTAMGLLDGDELCHPAARDAVLGDIPEDARQDMHLRAAELLHEEGESALLVATHLVAAKWGDAPWALAALERAAEQAMAEDRIDLAVSCLDQAVHSATEDDTLIRLGALLIAASWRCAPAVAARRFALLDRLWERGLLGTPQALLLVVCLVWYGRIAEARKALIDIGADADAQDDPEFRIAEMWLSCWVPLLLRRLPARSAGASRAEPPAAPPRAGGGGGTFVSARMGAETGAVRSSGLRFTAFSALHDVLYGDPDGSVLVRAEQVLERSRLSEKTYAAVESALLAMVYSDRLERAAYWSDSLRDEAAERRSPGWEAIFAAVRAEVALRQGDLRSAMANARFSLTYITPESSGLAVGGPMAVMVMAHTAVGEYDEAERLLQRPVAEEMLVSRPGLHYMYARGRYWAATGRNRAALGEFMQCGEYMLDWGMDRPSVVPWRAAAAEVQLRLGDREQARRLIGAQSGRIGAGQHRTRGATLRLLAECADPGDRERLLTEAVEALRVGGDRLELARALHDLSRLQQGSGDTRRAHTTARAAWETADACGARVLREEILPGAAARPGGAEPGEAGAEARPGAALQDPGKGALPESAPANGPGRGAPYSETLSEAELRVAALAARGLTNRQISNRLWITVSTVEQHLTRVYRKLKVARRRDLPTDLIHQEGTLAP
ncbi:helix-turn-helix transcriptional regulator [Nocardiopsis potens]|uniref:helix-turn-helix transcriptional regulator n=1 Tax=Nocardiopsis potens TaxID=1246458 RepID=UPI00034AD156|nr:LuxR family transcriptional regulator [Nocardiopsis potens]